MVSPTQVANLLLSSYFFSDKVNGNYVDATPVTVPVKELSQSTTFRSIDRTINHDWIDDDIAFSLTQKADNAPIPTLLWDKRIIASFPERSVDDELLGFFRKVRLSLYRKNLRRSLV